MGFRRAQTGKWVKWVVGSGWVACCYWAPAAGGSGLGAPDWGLMPGAHAGGSGLTRGTGGSEPGYRITANSRFKHKVV